MDEARYEQLSAAALRAIEDMLEDVDADLVDVERSGDVLTLTFAKGNKAVVNTQRPTRQIWLAANARAWHFSYDEPSGRWLSDRTDRAELFSQIASIINECAGLAIPIP